MNHTTLSLLFLISFTTSSHAAEPLSDNQRRTELLEAKHREIADANLAISTNIIVAGLGVHALVKHCNPKAPMGAFSDREWP
jgi:hypothetical protein